MVSKISSSGSPLLVLHHDDNVALLRRALPADTELVVGGQSFKLFQALGMGHKIAIHPIEKGESVLKYGAPIGFADCDIAVGDHVHLHNLTSRYTVIEDMEKNDAEHRT